MVAASRCFAHSLVKSRPAVKELVTIILIMNLASALGQVSYQTVRVGGLDIFYREAGPKMDLRFCSCTDCRHLLECISGS